jgi:hypothetical protein
MIAEGTFTYEKNGEIITTWNHVMKLDGYDWVETTVDEEKDIIISEIDLNDGEFVLVGLHFYDWKNFVHDSIPFVFPKKKKILSNQLSKKMVSTQFGGKESLTLRKLWRKTDSSCARWPLLIFLVVVDQEEETTIPKLVEMRNQLKKQKKNSMSAQRLGRS